MASITETPPAAIREELTRLRRQLARDIPKKTDRNLLIATWNLREFGDLTTQMDSTQADTPKRDLHALACIKEIVKRFDVVAIQEARRAWGRCASCSSGSAATGRSSSPTRSRTTRATTSASPSSSTAPASRSMARLRLVVPYSWSKAKRPKTGIAGIALDRQFARTPYAVSFKRRNGDLHSGHPPCLLGEQVRPGRQGACQGAELDRWMKAWHPDTGSRPTDESHLNSTPWLSPLAGFPRPTHRKRGDAGSRRSGLSR